MKSVKQRNRVLMYRACLLLAFSSPAAGFQVRLSGSKSSCSGRVEVFINDTWGTVCDDGWDSREAEVVCRQLNCGKVLDDPRRSAFGYGSGPIWLDDISCSGNERSLSECRHNEFGNHNCGHSEDAAVTCSDFQVRLSGSESSCSGRVEVFINGIKGTVCNDGWDLQEAEVVCRELNCGKAVDTPKGPVFGDGSGPIWLNGVSCSGGERSLSQCRRNGFGKRNCGHGEDAAVICSGFQVRLSGSESSCSGRVEVMPNGTWGTVCDDGWDFRDANVVCRQLNCGKALNIPRGSIFGNGSGPIWMDDVSCSGDERSLSECQHNGFGIHNCGHSEDASVICSGLLVRLNESESSCSGRVEVFTNDSWVTVCDDGWDLQEAEVVCRQLNCGKALGAQGGSFFGNGSGPVWFDGVSCSGNESSLSKCQFNGFGRHDCGHGEEAAVICSGLQIRLSGSESSCSGRVEVMPNGTWGTVCDDGWDFQDANVVCRQLNCGKAFNIPGGSLFGKGSGPIWLDDVSCLGDERSLSECQHNGFGKHNCGHKEDAAVICSDALQLSISLTSPNEGLVWTPEGAEVTRGYSFVVTCSTNGRYFDGQFSLLSSSSNIGWFFTKAVNHSVSFDFPVAEYEDQGNYSCVFEDKLHTRRFKSIETAPLRVVIKSSQYLPVSAVVRIVLLLTLTLVVFFVVCKQRQQAKQSETAAVEYHCEHERVDFADIEPVGQGGREENS
ncbi:deleted in malignant brain tumors 1 protein-like [Xyrichtys novacula]|uniref:Deleted in malignant brain tumors 1 protein-like n=1 Tax=Xyrichtys novacula TaxID=13765 RepID=A0AAV1FDZ2_XYRNO|nr:deleted in malignant brain tumors 1 protein-like [Xyrichtys novacula]